jgi:hypothetical protein
MPPFRPFSRGRDSTCQPPVQRSSAATAASPSSSCSSSSSSPSSRCCWDPSARDGQGSRVGQDRPVHQQPQAAHRVVAHVPQRQQGCLPRSRVAARPQEIPSVALHGDPRHSRVQEDGRLHRVHLALPGRRGRPAQRRRPEDLPLPVAQAAVQEQRQLRQPHQLPHERRRRRIQQQRPSPPRGSTATARMRGPSGRPTSRRPAGTTGRASPTKGCASGTGSRTTTPRAATTIPAPRSHASTEAAFG